MPKNALILDYDTGRYPFAKVLAALVFKTGDLSKLHENWKRQTGRLSLNHDDNLQLRNLMQQIKDDALFYDLYHHWIANIVAPHYGYKITYSAHPKMRVHLAGTGSVSDFHRDADVTKRPLQINCYLPFTDVYDSNTLWCEKEYSSKSYGPINLKYGQAILWDGGLLSHGTIKNETADTRISCDFRFQPKFPGLVKAPWSEILSARPAALTFDETIQPAGYERND